VRLATGESEKCGGTASNAKMTSTSYNGLQRKVYKFSGIFPLHGKPYKIVETRGGQNLVVV
jgi:hypothetical protein